MKETPSKSKGTTTRPTRKWIRPKKFIIADDTTLKKLLTPQTLPEPEFKGYKYIQGLGKEEEGSQSFTCTEPNCKATFTNPTSLSLHQYKHKDRTKRCQFCRILFKTQEELEKHTNELHPDLNLCPEADPLQCKKCKKVTKDAKALARHIRRIHSKLNCVCKDCGIPFTTPDNLRVHMKQKHPPPGEEIPRQVCSTCGKTFAQKRSLRTHIREVHRLSKTWRCVLCQTVYYAKYCYVNHMRRHTDPKFFPCKICNKTFRSMNHLNRHNQSFNHLQNSRIAQKRGESSERVQVKIETHESVEEKGSNSINYNSINPTKPQSKDELIQLCNKKVIKIVLWRVDHKIVTQSVAKPTKRELKLKKIKLGEENENLHLNCVYCNEEFEDLESVQHHEESCYAEIVNPKAHICPICDKVFSKESILKQHFRRHTNERPFQCTYCEKSFKTKTTRIQHEKGAHFGIYYRPLIHRTFKCNYSDCSKEYRSMKSLQKHISSRHLEITHKCEECGKVFRAISTLRNHVKADHSECPIRLECKPCKRTYKCRTSYLQHANRKRHHRKTLEFNRKIVKQETVDVTDTEK